MGVIDPHTLDGYVLDREDHFSGTDLDRSLWLPHHLPQWSSRTASAARYRLGDGLLRLVIEDDQPPWCPEFDGGTRVSSLQTGLLAGPVGSAVGQHRFSPRAVVREGQEAERLCTPHYGFFELRARFPADRSSMAALWMIGYEDEPDRSAERSASPRSSAAMYEPTPRPSEWGCTRSVTPASATSSPADRLPST